MNMTHFDAGEKNGGRPVVLLCVGGEGPPLEPDVVIDGDVHCSIAVTILAPMLGAAVFALEHRYYGKSNVTDDLSLENLRYLSSRQAVEDVAAFVRYAIDEYKIEKGENQRAQVVTFGGSYPGMVAGFSRLKYPDIISAAVASSAPVEATLNYQGYNFVVGEAIANPLVGGSKECRASVEEAFAALGDALHRDYEADALASKFSTCGGGDALRDRDNQRVLLETLSIIFPAQSNDPSCTQSNCNIEKVCETMIMTPGTTLSRLAALARDVLLGDGAVAATDGEGDCIDVDAKAERTQLLDTSIDNWDRVWFYQTCTEFAFYQTCDPGHCPFTTNPHLVTLESFTDDCEAAFNISADEVAANVKATNIEYGGKAIAGTKIFFPNGSVDPWYAAGVLKSLPEEPALMVTGASHHAWTHPPRATDQASVIAARKVIVDQVIAWLADDDSKEHAHAMFPKNGATLQTLSAL